MSVRVYINIGKNFYIRLVAIHEPYIYRLFQLIAMSFLIDVRIYEVTIVLAIHLNGFAIIHVDMNVSRRIFN